MAYSYPKFANPWKREAAQKIHPIRFSGRCAATSAPTTEKAIVRTAMPIMFSSMRISPRVRPFSRASSRLP